MTPTSTRARAWWLLGMGVAMLLVVTVAARTQEPSQMDLSRLEATTTRSCPAASAAESLLDGSAFLFEGVLEEIVPTSNGAAMLDFTVRSWYVGPPLQRTEVRMDRDDLKVLRAHGVLQPGSRLVVNGAGWSADGTIPTVNCEDILNWDAALDRDLHSENPSNVTLLQDGPVALYRSSPWLRTAPLEAPVLTGVLLVQNGCLHVDDGTTRWLVRFPDNTASWDQKLQSLQFDSQLLATGHTVRLAGSPADGLVPRRGQQQLTSNNTTRTESPARKSERACQDPGPVFIAAEPPRRTTNKMALGEGAPLVQAVLDAATHMGAVIDVRATGRYDSFTGVSAAVELSPGADSEMGEMTIVVDTSPIRAWPEAYLDDETYRSSLQGPSCEIDEDKAPTNAAGDMVVQHSPDHTRVLLRTSGAPLVAVTARPTNDTNELCILAALATAIATP